MLNNAKMMFIKIYAVNINITARLQNEPVTAVTIMQMAAMENSAVLFHPDTGVSEDFLNLSENMGISLTRSSPRMTDARGRKTCHAARPASRLSGRLKMKWHADPHSSAAEGVGRPMKSVLCRSSILNFASLRADITARNRGR